VVSFHTFPEPAPFIINIRLPPHQLEIDEDKFLRLLAGCASLHKIEKRMIIRSVPRFSHTRPTS
jgi:hypothetical protein